MSPVTTSRSQQTPPESNRRRVLVTGASSGIGESFAQMFASRHSDLVLVGRDRTALEQVASDARGRGAHAEVIVADLSTAGGVDAVCDAAGEVDTLVANAGVTHAATIGTTDVDELDRLAYLMSAGVVRMCERLVPTMVARGCGTVVIVSSIASFTPMRKAGPYAAAKSHVTAYAKSLALEVEPHGVRVLAVCPGYVRTDLHRRAGLDHLSRSVPGWMWLDPEDVVVAADKALAGRRHVLVPGRVYRLVLPFLSSRLAQGLWRRLTKRR
ncbi:MAG: SDR family NAD(P)-dependent oxidoreductase [Actinomycetota bacterium]